MEFGIWSRRSARARAVRLQRIELRVEELAVMAEESRTRAEDALAALDATLDRVTRTQASGI